MKLGLLAVTLVIAGFGQVRAQTILYDNIGASSAGSDSPFNFGPLADSFSTGGSSINIFDLKLLLNTTGNTGTITVSLLDDNTTNPGNILATLGTLPDSALTGSNAIYDFPFSPFSLNASTRYWIQVNSDDGSSANWSRSLDTSGTGVAGEFFANLNGVFTNGNGPYQMQLFGISAVPEPTTWALIGVGTLGTGVYAWRKKRLAINAGMEELKV